MSNGEYSEIENVIVAWKDLQRFNLKYRDIMSPSEILTCDRLEATVMEHLTILLNHFNGEKFDDKVIQSLYIVQNLISAFSRLNELTLVSRKEAKVQRERLF
jgi:hypothetical protein